MKRLALLALLFTFITMRVEAHDWSVYAGSDGGFGYVNGPKAAARFHDPHSLAVDAQGNTYVVDSQNFVIRKIAADGTVSTLAGVPGITGLLDGPGTTARFYSPFGIALAPDGALLVADNIAVRRVALDGTVTTLALASFGSAQSITVDPVSGTAYVIDGQAVCAVTTLGAVTTLAGDGREYGNVDSLTGAMARFFSPTSITLATDGNLYVADNNNSAIRRVTKQGAVTTLLTGFPSILAVAADTGSHLYVSSSREIKVVTLTPTVTVATVAGDAANSGYVDDSGTAARFGSAYGLCFNASGNLLVADVGNSAIREVTLAGAVTTYAGKGAVSGNANGVGTAARFNRPTGVAVDASGKVYVADSANNTVRQIATDRTVSVLAGTGTYGTDDGPGTSATFGNPAGLAAKADGTLYVGDTGTYLVREVSSSGQVTTLAGVASQVGADDGPGAQATFGYQPFPGVAPAGGTIYVADRSNQTIRTVAPAAPYTVATLAGAVGQAGSTDGTKTAARFSYPYGVAVDAAGNAYIVENGTYSIRKVTPGGVVTTLVGPGVGTYDDVGELRSPQGMAIDAAGNLYVADTGRHSIRKVTPTGRVLTVGGNGTTGSETGLGAAARFDSPTGIAATPAGKLYVTDRFHRVVVGVDTTTETPILLAPMANSATRATVKFELTEAALSGSVKVKFTPLAGSPLTLTLTNAYGTQGVHTFTFSPANPGADSAVVSAVTGTMSDSGSPFTVTLSYQDVLGNPVASTQVANVTIDSTTQTPGINPPLTNGTLSTLFNTSGFYITLPEPALADSVTLTLSNSLGSHALKLGSLAESAGQHLVRFNPAALPYAGTAQNVAVSGAVVPDGIYTATLSYQDAVGNPAASAQQTGVIVDTVTQALDAINFTAPTANAVVGTTITAKFTLPEAAGSAQLNFTKANNVSTALSIDPALIQAGTETTVTFDPRDPMNTSNGAITAGSSLQDGVYAVAIAYRDVGFNPQVVLAHTNVRIDTTAPTFNLPQNGAPNLRATEGALPDYTGLFTTNDNSTVMVTQDPPAFTDTPYSAQSITVTLKATDAAGNFTTTSFMVEVRPANPINTPLYISSTKAVPGTLAPGHGTGGLPNDARLASFGPPAIDEDGSVAFLAKWTSVSGPLKKGSGIFVKTAAAETCVAVTGGAAPIGGATFTSFLDPVISQGKVAFLATLAGVPKGQTSVIVSDAPMGTLKVVAQTGTDAHIGGATFKKFNGVQAFGNLVGFLAQVTGGTGGNKISAANDIGLWVNAGSNHDLICALREGDSIDPSVNDSKKVKTLVSFAVGAGSPGQGRGWLTNPYNVVMPALVILDDPAKTQAVLGGTEDNPLLLSLGGSTSLGPPAQSGATFQSYSFPAYTNDYASAFLGSLTIANGPPAITKLNARGIFLSPRTDLQGFNYTTVARLTDALTDSNGAAGTFSVLKDPVLAFNKGLAFPATIKGTTIKGAATTTLWWQPPGAALKMLAQGGHVAGSGPQGLGVPGVGSNGEFKTFNSLAIAADRGPLFTATLTAGKGGVLKTQTNGLWAVDFTGKIRQVFQTGTTPDGTHTLKSFTILNAVTGSMGVTRSFNDAGEITWLATFTDGKTAIMKTVIP